MVPLDDGSGGLSRRFSLRPKRLIWKSYDDGCVFFDLDSAETQLVSPLGYFLLEHLSRHPSGLVDASLVQRVHEEEPEVPMAECQAEVGEALEALLAAGLLTSVPCAS
ncbi:MAG: hypothetical protein CFE41_15100 [Burkholderiales bacterium PBB2]|nr:MAG: hypothetical protein CFE41_15100 [Burkholderiales bacterium PBB2]